jgi:hypothetical protein
MADVFDEPGWARGRRTFARLSAALTNAARAAGPPLLFGLRLWASVCLALYVAFWLELDNSFWAGTTAAIVCQPHLGASLRKGWYRMIGTLVGAVVIVVLTACFPQDRAPFLVALALWCAACALVATLLHNFASYSAALAGYTAAIIAADELGATGGPNADAVFLLAVYRASEICIGIVSAGIVLAGTDLGGAQRPAWPHYSRRCRAKSRAGLPACWRWPGRKCRRRSLLGRSWSGGSARSTRSSTRRKENPLKSVIIRRHCRELWTACSPPSAAGAR